MEVLVGGSAIVDIATRDDLHAQTDRITRLLERPHARFQIYHGSRAPRAANAPFALRLDTPRPAGGWMWLCQWCWLTGDDPTVSAAIANVRAAFLKGAAPPDSQLSLVVGAPPTQGWGGLDFPNILIPGLSIPTPNAVTIPDKMVVYDHEEAYFVLAGTGLVAGAGFYHASIGVIELPQTSEALTW